MMCRAAACPVRVILAALLLVLLLSALPGPHGPGGTVFAQTTAASGNVDALDYEGWETLASRAEDVIEAARASTQSLEALRSQLSDWRQRFDAAQGLNTTTIKTVRDQLAALGAVPEDGSEPPEIAKQRAELKRRLARLEAPAKTAELARNRADALISGIDAIIRKRQTEALLRLGPSPVNPVNLPEGVSALFGIANDVRQEVVSSWANAVARERFKGSLPVVLLLTLLGTVLLARGRRWCGRVSRRLLRDEAGPGQWISAFAVSLGEFLLPFAGVHALVRAVRLSALTGPQGTLILDALLPAAFTLLLARWLAQRIFPRAEMRALPLNLDEDSRYSGRLYGALMGLVIAAFQFLQSLADSAGWSETARNVTLFPVMVLAGLLLLRLAGILVVHSRAHDTADAASGAASDAEPDADGEPDDATATFRDRLARWLARALMAVAVLAPVLAAVGYVAAAQALMLPTLLSLLLLGALLILQRILKEVYVLLSGNRTDAEDSLVPILGGFLLVLASLPVFALIWGARPAQLWDWWLAFTEGVTLGGMRLSPTIFLKLVVVFVLGYLLTRLVQGTLKNTVLPKTRLDTGGRNAVVSGVGYLGIFASALIAITSAGIDLSSLAIVAGALSVGIGFGLQNIVSNFVSGIILLIERPIGEGDWIEVGGQHGYVRSISVRSTRIETFDRTDVIVPNADFVSGTVTNYTRGNTVGRVIVPVGVAYGSDTRKVEAILKAVAEAHPMVLMRPPPNVLFQGFGDSSLEFEIRAILRDVNWMLNVKSDMNHEIVRRFAAEGIEIPFPQQEIWIRSDTATTKLDAGALPKAAPAEPGGGTMAKSEADFDAGDGGGDGGGR